MKATGLVHRALPVAFICSYVSILILSILFLSILSMINLIFSYSITSSTSGILPIIPITNPAMVSKSSDSM